MRTLATFALAILTIAVSVAPAEATITGVTINGSTINAGGVVTLNGDGIEITSGSDPDNWLRFSSGGGIAQHSSITWLYGSGGIRLQADSTGDVEVNGGGTNTFIVSMPARFSDLLGGGTKVVCADNSGNLEYGCAEDRFAALEAQIRALQLQLNGAAPAPQPARPERIKR